jgi:type I restriction enzyme S subunit
MEETTVVHKKKTLMPKLRFKDFNDSWKKGTIGDYYENLRTGMTPSRTRPDYFKGDIPWISSGELNYGYIETTTESITQEAVNNTNLKIYPPNTLFIAITGLEAPGTRGKCGMNKVPAATNQSCLAFEEIPIVSTLFLFQWYKKNGIWLYYNFAQGTKQQSFNNKLVKGFIFNIPSLPEQQKIATFLSEIDKKNTITQQQKTITRGIQKRSDTTTLFWSFAF